MSEMKRRVDQSWPRVQVKEDGSVVSDHYPDALCDDIKEIIRHAFLLQHRLIDDMKTWTAGIADALVAQAIRKGRLTRLKNGVYRYRSTAR